MIDPVAVIRDWNSKLRIPFNPLIPFRLQDRSDSWCQEMLRFTKREIAEMSIILEIPDEFDNGQWSPFQHRTAAGTVEPGSGCGVGETAVVGNTGSIGTAGSASSLTWSVKT